jgi:hypothetical protein
MRQFLLLALLVACTAPLEETGQETALEDCPRFDVGASAGTVANDAIVEASGLAASRRHEGVLWVHNDSGDVARLFALSTSGETLTELMLEGVTPFDWEDLSAGLDPSGAPALYVADIGDNAEARSQIRVMRVREPEDLSSSEQQTSEFVALEARYPDGAHNAEAFFVDPRTGDLFVITKASSGGASGVYRYPSPQRPDEVVTLEDVGSLAFGEGSLEGSELVTGADISADGTRVLVRTYSHVWLWRRGSGTVAEALQGEVCEASSVVEPQGEAIAFDGGTAAAYFTLSELPVPGLTLPLFRFAETSGAP